MGLMEGFVMPSFLSDHFQLADFTRFHDEIRRLGPDLLIGKYVTDVPAGSPRLLPAESIGLLHPEGDAAHRRVGVYYLLTRTGAKLPATPLLEPYLDTRSPDGVGMTFDEEMVGWYKPGLAVAGSVDQPAGAAGCSFQLRMIINDLNEFIEGAAHEAIPRGMVHFDAFEGFAPASYVVDERRSHFNYLRVNPATAHAEMNYHLSFRSPDGRAFVLEGVKYMHRHGPALENAAQEVLRELHHQLLHGQRTQGRGVERARGRCAEVPHVRGPAGGGESGQFPWFLSGDRDAGSVAAPAGTDALPGLHWRFHCARVRTAVDPRSVGAIERNS